MFRMTYNERNLANIEKLADNTKTAAKKWYAFLLDNEIDLLIYETIRSEATQRANVAKGASQTLRSFHIVGQALDFVPVNQEGSANWAGYGSADVKKAVKKAKELGFKWGGDWTSFVDKPHLEFRHQGYGTDTFTKKVETEKAGVVSTPRPAPTPAKPITDSTTEKIQKTLNSRYDAKLVVDGIPGSKTQKALVKALQIELNKQYNLRLAVDGDFGRKTKASVPNLKKGEKGNITYLAQASLYFEGNDPKGVDGIFGAGTEKAVKAFQEANGLTADGIVGRDTFSKLFA